MTLRQAFRRLQPPLIFGDPAQIEAVRFIERVDEAEVRMQHCKRRGHIDEAGYLDLECPCIQHLPGDAISEAAERLDQDIFLRN